MTFIDSPANLGFDIYSDDSDISGTHSKEYTITIVASLTQSSSISESVTFKLTMVNPCSDSEYNTIVEPSSPQPTTFYTLNSGPTIVYTDELFYPENEICGEISLNAEMLNNTS